MTCPRVLVLALLLASIASPAVAQNWSFDARRIALGGVGSTENVASKLVEDQRRYRSIVVPLGLIQLLRDTSIFNPGDDAFDPVRAMEYAASPIHYTLGRDKGAIGQLFVTDIVNAVLNRDLNVYRGFSPPTTLSAEGLASPNWGKTIIVGGDRDGLFQGLYVGAGPYLSVQTLANLDQDLVDLLGSDSNRYIPNTTFDISNATAHQLALAITGGYRARLSLGGRPAAGTRDGIYLAANYNFLRGFRYEDFDLNVRLDTDSSGLLTLNPTTVPIDILRLTSQEGQGFALDFGAAIVADRWNFGFGASGVSNRIEWKEIGRQRWVLQSLLNGGEFQEIVLPALGETRRVELPVNYSADVAYHADN